MKRPRQGANATMKPCDLLLSAPWATSPDGS